MDQLISALALLGGNFLLTEAERREFSALLANQQEVIANLDSQMAIAQETLNKLIKQRNEVHRMMLSSTSASPASQKSIQDVIVEKEALLHQVREEIADTQNELERLLQMTRSSISNSDDLQSPIINHDFHITRDGLDTRLQQCRSHLERLVQQRNDAQNGLETHLALLSPIRRLPVEVLGVIFTFCIPRDRFVRPSPKVAPLLLLSVCSTWRNAALMTSSLWSSIWVKVQGRSCFPQLTLVKKWIERSGSRPLSFRVEESERATHPERALSPLSNVLDMFIPHASRWRRMHLGYKDSFSMKSGLSFLPEDTTFPLLESLYLERGYWIEPQDVDRIAKMLAAPNLRCVSWISQKPYSSVSFPWTQLVQFSLSHIITMKEGIWVLSECPQLQSAEFTLILPTGAQAAAPGNDSATGAIEHDCLQSLTLHMAGSLGALFNNLTLPRLRQLSLRALQGMFPVPPPPQYDISWPQDEFTSFLGRSGCALDSLSLSEIEIPSLHLLDCLRHVSHSLTELNLTNELLRQTYVDDDILRSLTLFSATEDGNCGLREPLCPNLTCLKLWGCISSSDGVLAQMLGLRWHYHRVKLPVHQLDMAMIALHADSPHAEDLAQIKKFNEKRFGITWITL